MSDPTHRFQSRKYLADRKHKHSILHRLDRFTTNQSNIATQEGFKVCFSDDHNVYLQSWRISPWHNMSSFRAKWNLRMNDQNTEGCNEFSKQLQTRIHGRNYIFYTCIVKETAGAARIAKGCACPSNRQHSKSRLNRKSGPGRHMRRTVSARVFFSLKTEKTMTLG